MNPWDTRERSSRGAKVVRAGFGGSTGHKLCGLSGSRGMIIRAVMRFWRIALCRSDSGPSDASVRGGPIILVYVQVPVTVDACGFRPRSQLRTGALLYLLSVRSLSVSDPSMQQPARTATVPGSDHGSLLARERARASLNGEYAYGRRLALGFKGAPHGAERALLALGRPHGQFFRVLERIVRASGWLCGIVALDAARHH